MGLTTDNFTRIKGDVNGNPRYVIHFLQLLTEKEKSDDSNIKERYGIAVKRANKIGGRKYHTKAYGGGIVFQSYNLYETIKHIEELLVADSGYIVEMMEDELFHIYNSATGFLVEGDFVSRLVAEEYIKDNLI